MNTTVQIESRNHKYANTYGGYIKANDFLFMTLIESADRIAKAERFNRSCSNGTLKMASWIR